MGFRDTTGSLELLFIDKTERTHIEFRVKQRANSKTVIASWR